MGKIRLEQLRFNGQVEKCQDPEKYLDAFKKGVEIILNYPSYSPTAEINKFYPGITSESRKINAKIIHQGIYYVAIDSGIFPGEKLPSCIRAKGYVQDRDSLEKVEEVAPEEISRLASIIGIKLGKDLIE
jgi:hypothetical protein